MRAIKTTTLRFRDDLAYGDGSYAILSHRWEHDEVSYQDYLEGYKRDSVGYAKIMNFCELARLRGHEWAWIDTCCIDKKSSSELSEAINSMYRWYSVAAVCYVYLSDVPPPSKGDHEQRLEAFKNSQWWRRGWTLQELLAPGQLEFFDSQWHPLQEREYLLDLIASITGIDERYIRCFNPYSHTSTDTESPSVATMMSWICDRVTKKPEDMAYCLMGMFGVNMPLLYGEGGSKAFVRLQIEIIKKTNDQSIFAWKGPGDGLLASWPTYFLTAQKIRRIWVENPLFQQKPFSITNRGLKLREPTANSSDGHRFVLMHCCTGECDNCLSSGGQDTSDERAYEHHWLAVKLKQVSGDQWKRASWELFRVDPRAFTVDSEPMYVIQDYL